MRHGAISTMLWRSIFCLSKTIVTQREGLDMYIESQLLNVMQSGLQPKRATFRNIFVSPTNRAIHEHSNIREAKRIQNPMSNHSYKKSVVNHVSLFGICGALHGATLPPSV